MNYSDYEAQALGREAETAGDNLMTLSRWIDESPRNAARSPEARTWGRLAKIQEEAGEVISAYISYTGQNPRKEPNNAALVDVGDELLDVALTALAAYEHLSGNQGIALFDLFEHIKKVDRRRIEKLRQDATTPGGAQAAASLLDPPLGANSPFHGIDVIAT
jgi:NTP pyrophosphatase (non-canonical NTP hydrolase)